ALLPSFSPSFGEMKPSYCDATSSIRGHAHSYSLVVAGPAEDTSHVRRRRLLATIPLALIAVGGCRTRASSTIGAVSPEGCATGDAGRAPLPNSPNVIIVLTDDQGYSDVGAFGAQGFTTPNLDRLATEGVKLTNFYV